jgi:hypothetical protein
MRGNITISRLFVRVDFLLNVNDTHYSLIIVYFGIITDKQGRKEEGRKEGEEREEGGEGQKEGRKPFAVFVLVRFYLFEPSLHISPSRYHFWLGKMEGRKAQRKDT